jgi:hypothetical protein
MVAFRAFGGLEVTLPPRAGAKPSTWRGFGYSILPESDEKYSETRICQDYGASALNSARYPAVPTGRIHDPGKRLDLQGTRSTLLKSLVGRWESNPDDGAIEVMFISFLRYPFSL